MTARYGRHLAGPWGGGRRAGWVAAGLVLVLVAATGCGVPTSSGAEYVGPGPQGGSTLGSGGIPPPLADVARGPEEQVENFLQAAAGSPDTAADRVREYLRAGDRETWDPGEEIRVIRLEQSFVTPDADGGWMVELHAQLVGELHPHGYLDASTSVESVTYAFRVVTEGGPDRQVDDQLRLRIADPPPYLLLADTALANENYYYPNPIYFWDADHEVLVPDLRWLPLAGESVEQHPWTVVRWLLAGPAPDLPRIEGLPAGAQHTGLPVWEGDRLVVNFNAAAVEGSRDVDDLATQLTWSLSRLRDGGELELRIDDRPQEARARSRPQPDEPRQFVILDGIIRQYGDHDSPLPPVLTSPLNTGLEAAALTSHGEVAALVRELPDGRQELTVARVRFGNDPIEEPSGVPPGQLGQPIWLSSGGAAVGLVVADGQLYRFTSTGTASAVPVSGIAGSITAVAVAPERRRLALIAGDQLYLAQLRYDRDSVTVQAPRPLPTTVRQLAAVAFSHETQLVVAGERDSRVSLYQLTVDGAVAEQLHDLSNATVTAVVAHPSWEHGDLPVLMYEANGQAYTFTGVPSLVQPEQLSDPPEVVESPPRAPFFLD